MKDDANGQINPELLLEAARVLTEGDVVALCQMVDQQAVRLMKETVEANGDADIIASKAHEIAGMLDNFGFKRAAYQAGALELAARDGDDMAGPITVLGEMVSEDVEYAKVHYGNAL